MLRAALIFLVLAIIAAVFAFGGLLSAAASIARLIFYLFLAIFVTTLIAGLVGGYRISRKADDLLE